MGLRGWRAGLVVLFVTAGCAVQSVEPSAVEEPVGSSSEEWEAASVTESTDSSHLWLVERGLAILGLHEDHAAAKNTRTLMLTRACTTQWQQGLFDADYLHEYNNGSRDLSVGASDIAIGLSGASWKSHFFDPDTGLNYKGEASPTAYTEALRHLTAARAHAVTDMARACYALGLSLHFITDLTQPMHAASFTALTRPRKLHTNVEVWAMDLHGAYPLADWTGAPSMTAGSFVVSLALGSKRLWERTWNVFADAYEAHPNRFVCGSMRAPAWNIALAQQIDRPTCWNTNPTVRAQIGFTLRRAQDMTAQYLYLVNGLR